MHRFYSENITRANKTIQISDLDELHHLAHVLRLKAGDEVELVNGKGLLAEGSLSLITKTRAEVQVERIIESKRKAGPRIVLACALPKKAKFEFILEKATELGVDEIVPLLTERTEIVLGKDAAHHKGERYLRVIFNACKQSKRLWFPELHPIMPFAEAVKMFAGPSNVLFIPWLEGERVFIRQAFESLNGKRVERMIIFIGPEGDFTPDEVGLARRAGAQPLDLGDTVLKVDTAALAVLAYARFMGTNA